MEQAAAALGTRAVFYNRRYEPAQVATDDRVARELKDAGLRVESFAGFLLHEPREVRMPLASLRWLQSSLSLPASVPPASSLPIPFIPTLLLQPAAAAYLVFRR